MEFILISDTKLKIMLTASDMAELLPDGKEPDYGDPDTRRMFRELLRRAKAQTGFDTDGSRVLVQLFSSKKGGCEVFVTKLGALNEPLSCEPDVHYKPSYYTEEAHAGAFGFDTLSHLLSVCRRLWHIGYGGDSSVYAGDDRRYYLFLHHMDTSEELPVDEFSFIGEYGTGESYEATRHFVCEHGRPLCRGDAVRILGEL